MEPRGNRAEVFPVIGLNKRRYKEGHTGDPRASKDPPSIQIPSNNRRVVSVKSRHQPWQIRN